MEVGYRNAEDTRSGPMMFRPRKPLTQTGSYFVTAAPRVSENEESRCDKKMILDDLDGGIISMLTSHLGRRCM